LSPTIVHVLLDFAGWLSAAGIASATSFASHEVLLSEMPNTLSFERCPELGKRAFEPVSLSTGPQTAADRIAALLHGLPSAPAPQGVAYDNLFRVTVPFGTPAGQIILFDTCNLFYRNGGIDGIRARLRAEAARGGAAADRGQAP
jgi:hypothetical protein